MKNKIFHSVGVFLKNFRSKIQLSMYLVYMYARLLVEIQNTSVKSSSLKTIFNYMKHARAFTLLDMSYVFTLPGY